MALLGLLGLMVRFGSMPLLQITLAVKKIITTLTLKNYQTDVWDLENDQTDVRIPLPLELADEKLTLHSISSICVSNDFLLLVDSLHSCFSYFGWSCKLLSYIVS